jgi:hypothetical protein
MTPDQSNGIIPIAFTYEQERDEQHVLGSLRPTVTMGTQERKVAVEFVVDDRVQTHEFVVLEYTITQRLATKAEMRFRDRVRRLFHEMAEGVDE